MSTVNFFLHNYIASNYIQKTALKGKGSMPTDNITLENPYDCSITVS